VSTVNQWEALLEGEYGQTSGAFYGNLLKQISALQADLIHLKLSVLTLGEVYGEIDLTNNHI
jgi:hypothetical protein